jgi:hypothetical protein
MMIAFWTWLWVLATPLTVCLVVLGKYVPQMEIITVLMSDEGIAESKIIFYQRLLAKDQDEAAHTWRWGTARENACMKKYWFPLWLLPGWNWRMLMNNPFFERSEKSW